MMINISSELSDEAIASEVGRRLKAIRLQQDNLTQVMVARRAQCAINTVQNLEHGKGTLGSFIAVLRVLDALDQLNDFLPSPGISPMMMLKQPKPRQRARAKTHE